MQHLVCIYIYIYIYKQTLSIYGNSDFRPTYEAFIYGVYRTIYILRKWPFEEVYRFYEVFTGIVLPPSGGIFHYDPAVNAVNAS